MLVIEELEVTAEMVQEGDSVGGGESLLGDGLKAGCFAISIWQGKKAPVGSQGLRQYQPLARYFFFSFR
jgi:hypothetical protein